MFDLDKYLADLILNCRSAFGERLLYMGLQGSWLRGETHENSDIDIMVILDGFSVRDMDTYREILKEIGFYEKSCGFICGKDEMKRWNPLEVCQLRHTTKDLVGVLMDFLPPATREDEINYVNLVFYLIRDLHFLESGHFILSRKDLKEAVTEEDRIVLEMAELPDSYDFDGRLLPAFVTVPDILHIGYSLSYARSADARHIRFHHL